MIQLQYRLSRPWLAALVLGPVLSAGPTMADGTETFIVQQDVPVLFERTLTGEGDSHADLVGFEAPISTSDGKTGILSGILITIDIPEGGGDVFEDRLGNLVFDFGMNDTILAAGKSVYGSKQTEMQVDLPQIRAVTGGTGVYIGARGQVTTTRNADGTYSHAIELLK